MNDPYHNPVHAAVLDSALVKLDRGTLARKLNELTGSSLSPESVITLARQVGFTAIRTPGKAVCVAGIRGVFDGHKLELTLCGEITEIEIPTEAGI